MQNKLYFYYSCFILLKSSPNVNDCKFYTVSPVKLLKLTVEVTVGTLFKSDECIVFVIRYSSITTSSMIFNCLSPISSEQSCLKDSVGSHTSYMGLLTGWSAQIPTEGRNEDRSQHPARRDLGGDRTR